MAVQVNELRIGNLVLDEQLEPVFVVYLLTNRLLASASGDNDEYSKYLKTDEIKPIPLTEEWRIKIGKNKDIVVLKDQFSIFPKNGRAYHFLFEDHPFVHSIQNLYFALTGEELVFDMSK